jgi:FkbM family methyltransferase
MASRTWRNRWRLPLWILNHPSNKSTRFRALMRAGHFQFRGRVLRRPTLARLGEQAVLLAHVNSSAASKAVYANPPDAAQMRVWSARLQPGDLFIDVGANVGVYSLWAAGHGAKVVALEPGPLAASRLRANVALNPAFDVQVIEAALSDRSRTLTMDFHGDTTAHISAIGAEVVSLTLDEVIGDRIVAGVKIDVEGAERLVLEGAAVALREQRIRCLQLEWNAASTELLGEGRAPIVDLLSLHGYRLYRPDTQGELHSTDGALESSEDLFALPA